MELLEQAAIDPDFVPCVSYDFRVDVVQPLFGFRVVLSAPNIAAEVGLELKAAVTPGAKSKYLSNKVPGLIVANFDINVFQFQLDRLKS
jgi:glycerol-3-phosphate dehydrogenase